MEQNQSRDLPPEEVTDRQEPLFPDGETDGGQPSAVDEGENPDLEPSPAPLPPPYADMTGTGCIIFSGYNSRRSGAAGGRTGDGTGIPSPRRAG